MTDVFASKFEQVVRGKIQAQIDEETGHLAGGLAEDFPDYKKRSGKIEGLNFALSFCEEARSELLGDNKKDSK